MSRDILLTLMLFLVSIGLLACILYYLSTFVFSTKTEDNLAAERVKTYECGYASLGDARGATAIKYYLVAILFLLFDLEIVFLLPFTLTLGWATTQSLAAVAFFLFVITVGYLYEWKKGGLD